MSTVQEIKSAIELLNLEERAILIAELCGRVDDDWDRKMSADAAAGKFDALNAEANHAHRTDQTKSLDDILGPS